MADFYSPGNVRVFYRSTGFKADLDTTAYITMPDFSVLPVVQLRNLGGGVYCLEYRFTVEGSYLLTFYENGVAKTIQHLEIRRRRAPNGNGLINL